MSGPVKATAARLPIDPSAGAALAGGYKQDQMKRDSGASKQPSTGYTTILDTRPDRHTTQPMLFVVAVSRLEWTNRAWKDGDWRGGRGRDFSHPMDVATRLCWELGERRRGKKQSTEDGWRSEGQDGMREAVSPSRRDWSLLTRASNGSTNRRQRHIRACVGRCV